MRLLHPLAAPKSLHGALNTMPAGTAEAGGTPHLLDASMFWSASGGVRRYVAAKHAWLRAHTPWRHTVAAPFADELCTLRLPALPLPGSRGAYRFPWRRRACAALLRASAPDIIESADPYRLAWAALDAAQALGIPSVAFCHSNLEQMARMAAGPRLAPAAARAARRYAAHLYRQFDLVLAPSQAMVNHLLDWGVAGAVHQPLGVDATTFRPLAADPARRAALGLPAQARILLYAGRFAPEKNLDVLADAVRLLAGEHWLVAVGAGPAPPRGARVRVLPQVADAAELARLMGEADVFVHAGAQETFGLSVLEAMACGLPVVARAAEGLAERVDDSVGCAVQGASAAAFAEAVAATLARDRHALRRAARERAVAQDWQQVLPQLWQRYRYAMGTAPLNAAAPAPRFQP